MTDPMVAKDVHRLVGREREMKIADTVDDHVLTYNKEVAGG
jgi:hypothetical protein